MLTKIEGRISRSLEIDLGLPKYITIHPSHLKDELGVLVPIVSLFNGWFLYDKHKHYHQAFLTFLKLNTIESVHVHLNQLMHYTVHV